MAYQPTFPSPYMETIDATQEGGNVFKCLINPKDTINRAEINIYKNDDASLIKTVSFSEDMFPFVGGWSDKSWLSCTIDEEGLCNGVDYKWNITLYVEEERPYGSGSTGMIQNPQDGNLWIRVSTFSNGFLTLYEKYKELLSWYIQVNSETAKIKNVRSVDGVWYDVYVDYTAFTSIPAQGDKYRLFSDTTILTSPEYYFKARTNPVVTFDVPETISNSAYIFSATYSQEQKVGVAYFQYDLYSKGEFIVSSGKVFTQNISHTFENLVNGTEYVVKLTIVNNDGVEIYEERTFNVDYPIMATTINPIISVDNDKTCISVDFSNNASIPSTLIGTDKVNYKTFGDPDYVVISSGNVIAYSSPSITIEPYDNIMSNMCIKIGEEIIRIISYTRKEDGTIVATLKNDFSTNPLIGSYYEVCSYYNGIHLDEGRAILWDNVSDKPLVIPDRSSQAVHWHGSHGFNGLILEKINSEFVLGSTTVSYDGENFTYKLGTSEAVNYSPYLGTANTIAGRDEHSVVGTIQAYDASSSSVTLENPEFITVGRSIQIGNEYRTITDIVVNGETVVATLDRAFDIEPTAEDTYAVYDDNYLYVLSDDDELSDTDILIDNDLSYKYWWLIVLLPDSVKFVKTVPFIESEV